MKIDRITEQLIAERKREDDPKYRRREGANRFRVEQPDLYNESRRTVREESNAEIAALSDQDRKVRIKQQNAKRQAKRRAAKKSVKAAAMSGDLSAAINDPA